MLLLSLSYLFFPLIRFTSVILFNLTSIYVYLSSPHLFSPIWLSYLASPWWSPLPPSLSFLFPPVPHPLNLTPPQELQHLFLSLRRFCDGRCRLRRVAREHQGKLLRAPPRQFVPRGGKILGLHVSLGRCDIKPHRHGSKGVNGRRDGERKRINKIK